MLSFIFGFILGGVFVYWVVVDTDKNVKQATTTTTKEADVLQANEPSYYKYNHVKPGYYGYGGGYATLTVCTSCYRTSLREDQHPVNPCKRCGSEVIDSESGGYSPKISGKWLSSRKKWCLAPSSYNPYPKPEFKDVEEPLEKDITPTQPKLHVNS